MAASETGHVPPSPVVRRRAGCFCFNEDRSQVMLVSSTKYPGCWSVPSGGVEEGEDDCTAAVRESEEEAGVRGTVVADLGVAADAVRSTHMFELRVESLLPEDAFLDAREKGRTRRWFALDEAVRVLDRLPLMQSLLRRILAEPASSTPSDTTA